MLLKNPDCSPRSAAGLGAVQRGARGALLRPRLHARGGVAAVLRLLAPRLVVPQLQGAAEGMWPDIARRLCSPRQHASCSVEVLYIRLAALPVVQSAGALSPADLPALPAASLRCNTVLLPWAVGGSLCCCWTVAPLSVSAASHANDHYWCHRIRRGLPHR